MTRRFWLLPALAWSACKTSPRDEGTLLPATIAGAWQRKSLRPIPPPQPSVVRAFEAAYEGPGKLTVDLYEAKVSGTAFEMTQHWRAEANTVFFDKGTYFAVVKWEQTDRQALTQFVRELQKSLAKE
jgi:hypothetical protein